MLWITFLLTKSRSVPGFRNRVWWVGGVKFFWQCQYFPFICYSHPSLTSESRVLSVGLTKSVVVTCSWGFIQWWNSFCRWLWWSPASSDWKTAWPWSGPCLILWHLKWTLFLCGKRCRDSCMGTRCSQERGSANLPLKVHSMGINCTSNTIPKILRRFFHLKKYQCA